MEAPSNSPSPTIVTVARPSSLAVETEMSEPPIVFASSSADYEAMRR